MNFLHFETIDGIKKTEAKSPGYQIYGDSFDDIDLILKIDNGKIKIDVFDTSIFDKSDLSDIRDHINHIKINWENGFEFIDYNDIDTDEELILKADKNSEVFDALNSQQNQINIQSVLNKIK